MERKDFHQNFNCFFDGLRMQRKTDDRTEYMELHSWMGEGFVQRIVPRADLGVAIADFKLYDSQKINLHTGAPMVEISYCLQGNRDIHVAGEQFEVPTGSYTLQFVNPVAASMQFSGNRSFQMLSIGIPVSTFHHFMENASGARSVDFHRIIGEKPYRLFQEPIEPAASILLKQILQSTTEPDIRNLEMEYRLLELISLGFRSFLTDGKTASPKLSRTDREKMEQAKNILLERMADPPSLLELSRLIGMNDYKLKIAFKEIYGNTVFGYLREKRLEKAYHLLQDGRTSVIEVSFAVGYSNPSYFAEAFRKKYGINPGEFLRRL